MPDGVRMNESHRGQLNHRHNQPVCVQVRPGCSDNAIGYLSLVLQEQESHTVFQFVYNWQPQPGRCPCEVRLAISAPIGFDLSTPNHHYM